MWLFFAFIASMFLIAGAVVLYVTLGTKKDKEEITRLHGPKDPQP
jgi:hypothetical protein